MSAITERPARATRSARVQNDHLVHRRRDGRVVTEDGHGSGVSDEQARVGAGLVRQPPDGASYAVTMTIG